MLMRNSCRKDVFLNMYILLGTMLMLVTWNAISSSEIKIMFILFIVLLHYERHAAHSVLLII